MIFDAIDRSAAKTFALPLMLGLNPPNQLLYAQVENSECLMWVVAQRRSSPLRGESREIPTC
ncbi:MAG: hypothetical protein CME57_01310, partial [Halieaceae bacterium]|nr:hypothetical protein [Halieaceae bacterium]